MENKSFANQDVLNFYKLLPFNARHTVQQEIQAVRDRKIEGLYPGLSQILTGKTSVLEVGCGVGWLSNSINYLYHCPVTGIDFNPVAIQTAKEVSSGLKLNTNFSVEDLFLYTPPQSFDVVISFGVLHHTNNCAYAVQRLCEKFVKPGGQVMIGLYHKYGRQPFLDHFQTMKNSGATEEKMLNRYRELQSYLKDETHLLSWFRDQVLHPHETQHTLEEMLPILEKTGMELTATSINGFKPFGSLNELIQKEKEYTEISKDRLMKNQYFPGFFVFSARKK